MTAEAINIIAEVEGIKTPTRKRSRKEVEAAISEFSAKNSAKKKTRKAKTSKSSKPTTPAKTAGERTKAIADIKRIPVTENPGNIRSAGYDPKTNRLHTEFEKSVIEWPDTTAAEWKELKATFDDKEVDTGAYFRRAFRGRAGKSRRVYDQPSATGASKEAPASSKNADQEVSKS